MGVDIQTYRARIGTYSNSYSRDGDTVKFAKQINIREGVETVGCLIFIGILLVMAGIELNPGPREKESSNILELINIPDVKIFGLNENINKEVLEAFFELEEKHGGGKIKNIVFDSTTKCATLSFKEKNDFDAFVNRKPSSIFGNEVTIEIIDTRHIDTNVESRRIKISGLVEHINKEMLELFFEKEQRAGGGKVKFIDIDNKNKCVFVDFEEKSGVQWIMKKTPLSIFGMKVHTEIVETDIGEHKMIKITKLPAFLNREMLKMFFEHKTDCSGNVVELTVNCDENCAIVEFDESEAVNKILAERPLTIFQYEVEVDVFILKPPNILEPLNIPRVRITGLKEYVNKEMLEAFFLNEERHGGGKVKYIDIDNRNASATIDFHDKAGIDAFMKRKPKSIFDMEITVELIGVRVHSDEPRKIKITKLPVHINCAMLTSFFESKMNYDGNILDVTVDTEHHFAIVEFDNPTAVSKVMDKKPFTIFEYEVDVDVCDDKVSSETEQAGRSMQLEKSLQTTDTTSDMIRAKSTIIKIYGLAENTNKKMLELFFETEEKMGGGKVNNIFIDKQNECVIIEFKDETGAEWIMNETPRLILGQEVEIEKIDDIDQPKKIQIIKLPVSMNKDMLKVFFEDKTYFGGKVIDISINSEENKAIVEFDNSAAVYRIMDSRPFASIGLDVDVEVLASDTLLDRELQDGPRIRIFGQIENTNKEMLAIEPEHGEQKSGRKVKDIDMDQKGKCVTTATTDFEEEAGSNTLSEEPNMIKITEVSINMTRVVLKNFFENTIQCGGKVMEVTVNFKERFAIVTFDSSAAVYEIMKKRPLKLLGIKVDVDVFRGKVDSETEHTEKSLSGAESLQITGENVNEEIIFAGRRKHSEESVQTTETITAAHAEYAPPEFDDKEPHSSQENDTGGTNKEIFWQMLAKLGLTNKYPDTISIRDIVAVDACEWNKRENGTICSTDIPWLVLKRLICSHSECRDISVTNEQDLRNDIDLENILSFSSDMPDDKQEISPLDVLFIIFQCCDPFLKQVFVQKLYLCKIAVPFLYKYWETKEKQVSVLSVWPLRSLVIENKQKSDGNSEFQCKEIDILDLPTKMIAFGRLGRPRYSKSKLMNSILSDHGCKTFFNFDSPSGMTKRKLSNGQVEMFWLPLTGDKKDRFQEPMTCLNLRGDLKQHFDAEIQTFISTFVDTLTLIVDIETILKRSRNVIDVLMKFSSVILIIANPITQDTIQAINEFKTNVLTFKPHINLRVLSTYKGDVEQNAVDMVSLISVHITDHLQKKCTKSHHERLREAKIKIRTDEDDENCQIGKQKSKEMIMQMNDEGVSCSWKQTLTPVHSKFSKELGKLIKKREREKDFQGVIAIDAQIKTVRETQIMSITKSVKLFTYVLKKYENKLQIQKYFLCWLHFYIGREKRRSLPQLMNEHRLALGKLKLLKSNEKPYQSDIVKQENIITEQEKKIDEASFSVEFFFREIGHINDAILDLEKDFATLELPQLCQMSNIIGRLVADGHQLELIDGESFYMPFKWIKAVVNAVDQYIGEGKVLSLSVLGLQSSGKSTFLNTMFGCHFSTRTGRCTRGIHAQLIPVVTNKFKDKLSDFNFILVVDTEGLRSPELSHVQHEHDNELATVITGIADITLINIMGENTSEIRDILQMIVRAFLRLNMTNKDLDIKKSCSFIHQNITDISAPENMMSGLHKLIQTLDEMTKESAKNECRKDITTFNQVIQFDIHSQVWYLKNLWQGNPPMARVNTEYSEGVVDIKYSILKKALTMNDKSYKSLSDITEHAHNLWKGVLNEDFVFSFRNTIEIKAYMAMEIVVQDQLWRLESLIRDKLIHISQNRFANCDKQDNLSRVKVSLTSDLNELLLAEKRKSKKVINEYFKNDKYKDIIIKWQKNQEIRVDKLCQSLEQSIEDQIKKDFKKREVEILTVSCHMEHEAELRRMSVKIANENRGKTLSRYEKDYLFNSIWQSFVTKLNIPATNLEKNRSKMSDLFYTCLTNMFKNYGEVLEKVLEGSNRLTPLTNVTKLKETFSRTGIDKKDITLSRWGRKANWIKSSFRPQVMKNIEIKTNELFEAVDEKIERMCQVGQEITAMAIKRFLHDIHFSMQNMFNDNTQFECQMPVYIKLAVHISRHAHVVFVKHNENYFNTYGVAARLKSYKLLQQISFEAHLCCRFSENIVSKLFINVIESFAEEWTLQTLSNRVHDDLFVELPSVKNRAIIQICTDLLEKDDFDNFVRYIHAPKDYASSWITHKANHVLFAPESRMYANISSSLLRNMLSTVKACVQNVKNKYTTQSCASIDDWVKCFQNQMKESGFFIPTEMFRNMKKETETIENLEYLTDEVLVSLKGTEADLVSRFNEVDCGSVQWANLSPIERLIQKIWGCQEQCPFCGEPCTKNEDHTGSDHMCMQHRPLCCIGIRFVDSQIAELASCDFNVQSNKTHLCGDFAYKCNSGKREPCIEEKHPYTDYKTILNEWYIVPSANMHDTSRFWMWFVATYKDRLLDYYQYRFEDIPSSWKDITKSSALKSLSETFFV